MSSQKRASWLTKLKKFYLKNQKSNLRADCTSLLIVINNNILNQSCQFCQDRLCEIVRRIQLILASCTSCIQCIP
ncbi:hypothetical protein COCOBI_pt-0590 (chloroplast) [Coccomyxa sp. Obi]|nr:hypothetical protein COCOBI_pt-0590 [Coccomyxa sp. Obi]